MATIYVAVVTNSVHDSPQVQVRCPPIQLNLVQQWRRKKKGEKLQIWNMSYVFVPTISEFQRKWGIQNHKMRNVYRELGQVCKAGHTKLPGTLVQGQPRKNSPPSVCIWLLYSFLYLCYATDPGYFCVAHPVVESWQWIRLSWNLMLYIG
jgi:hypothetical protein